MPKLKLAIEDLSYCGGCDTAIADLGEVLVKLLQDKFDLVYAPLVMSAKDFDYADVCFVVGAVGTEHDLERLRHARKVSKILVSFGSCNAFGGIPALRNLYPVEDVLKWAYEEVPTLEKPYGPPKYPPKLMKTVLPAAAYVKVDYIIPGCPPCPAMIQAAVIGLLKKLGLA